MICRNCDEEFERKLIKRGFIDQCDTCSGRQEEPERFLGRTNEKNEGIEVFRKDLQRAKQFIQNEARAGMVPNISLSSYKFESKGEE